MVRDLTGAGAGPGGGWPDLPRLDGTLLIGADAGEGTDDDEGAFAAAADDFGHVVHRRPAAVLRPGSVADVVAMVRYCDAHGVRAAARGRSHSGFGQAQVAGGLVIETASLAGIGEIGRGAETGRAGETQAPDTVTVGGGATWSSVVAATLPHGLTPPVLTDYLELSVGGTLSVGGLGGQGHAYGAQVDHVTALQVVTGTGELVRCSRTERGDLFHAVLAGLGQCAIIVEATLGLIPAPLTVRHYLLPYGDLRVFLEDQRLLATDHRFGYVEGQVVPGDGTAPARYLLEAAAYGPPVGPEPDDGTLLEGLRFDERASAETGADESRSATPDVLPGAPGPLPGAPPDRPEIVDLPYADFLDRLSPGVEVLKAAGIWGMPHPWADLFLPGRDVAGLAAGVLDTFTPENLGPGGLILLYPLAGARLRTPLLRTPDDPMPFVLALLRTGSPEPEATARALAHNYAAYSRVRDGGGTWYPSGAVPLTPAEWRTQYGDSWEAFETAKRRYDPRDNLVPGQGVFHH